MTKSYHFPNLRKEFTGASAAERVSELYKNTNSENPISVTKWWERQKQWESEWKQSEPQAGDFPVCPTVSNPHVFPITPEAEASSAALLEILVAVGGLREGPLPHLREKTSNFTGR